MAAANRELRALPQVAPRVLGDRIGVVDLGRSITNEPDIRNRNGIGKHEPHDHNTHPWTVQSIGFGFPVIEAGIEKGKKKKEKKRNSETHTPYIMGLHVELGNLFVVSGASSDAVGMFAHSGVFADYLEQHVAVWLAAHSRYEKKTIS